MIQTVCLGAIVTLGGMLTGAIVLGVLVAIFAAISFKTRDQEALEKLEALLDRTVEKMK